MTLNKKPCPRQAAYGVNNQMLTPRDKQSQKLYTGFFSLLKWPADPKCLSNTLKLQEKNTGSAMAKTKNCCFFKKYKN
jgi:hypothetical protein